MGSGFLAWVSYHSCGRAPLRLGAVCAGVLLEGFLRQAVEGEGGDGAFETRRCDAPGAVGAAPASEVVALDPDQAFIHTSPALCLRFGILGSATTGGTRQYIERGRWTPARRRRLFFTELGTGKSDLRASP